jgi:RHS repeat-associated protein
LVLSLSEKYDVYGRRIEEDRWTSTTGTVVTRFGYDGANVWADLDGSNNLLMRYVRPDGVDALGARESSTGTVAWYGTDNQGSVRDILSASGTDMDRISYSGYGKVLSESNSANGDRYKYTGAEYQTDTLFTLNEARWYDTGTGRWLSMDPIGFAAGDVNLYRYVGNNPTNSTDPSGLQTRGSDAFSAQFQQLLWRPLAPRLLLYYNKGTGTPGGSISVSLSADAKGSALISITGTPKKKWLVLPGPFAANADNEGHMTIAVVNLPPGRYTFRLLASVSVVPAVPLKGVARASVWDGTLTRILAFASGGFTQHESTSDVAVSVERGKESRVARVNLLLDSDTPVTVMGRVTVLKITDLQTGKDVPVPLFFPIPT